jgi:hypothetical protein
VGAFVTMRVAELLRMGTALRFDTPPYATASYVILGVVAALTIYGLGTALAGRSLFGDEEGGATPALKV